VDNDEEEDPSRSLNDDDDAGGGVFCLIQVEAVPPLVPLTTITSSDPKTTISSSLPKSTYFSIQLSPIHDERIQSRNGALDPGVVYLPMPAMPERRKG